MMDAFKQLPHTHNVLCIFPWEQGVSVTNWLPPLGLEYISAAIESVGIHTHIVDMRFEVEPVPLATFPAEAICISVNWEDQLSLLPRLLGNVTSDQTIIVGGRAASFHTPEVFNQCPQVTIVVRGDGEETIREIFSGKSIETIQGSHTGIMACFTTIQIVILIRSPRRSSLIETRETIRITSAWEILTPVLP